MRKFMTAAVSAAILLATPMSASAITQAQVDFRISQIRIELTQARKQIKKLQKAVLSNRKSQAKKALLRKWKFREIALTKLLKKFNRMPVSG